MTRCCLLVLGLLLTTGCAGTRVRTPPERVCVAPPELVPVVRVRYAPLPASICGAYVAPATLPEEPTVRDLWLLGVQEQERATDLEARLRAACAVSSD